MNESAEKVEATDEQKWIMANWKFRGNTAEWKARWCQSVIEDIAVNQSGYKPIVAAEWNRVSLPEPPTADSVSDLPAALYRHREMCAAQRRADARDESARRLRTTLRCEAWLREQDVTSAMTNRFYEWHKRLWGIEVPAPIDVAEIEALVQETVKRVVK